MPLRADFVRMSKKRFQEDFQDRLLRDADEKKGFKTSLVRNDDKD